MRYINIADLEYQRNFGIMGSEAIIYKTNDGYFKKFNVTMDLKTRKNKELKLFRLDKYENIKQYYNQIICMVNNLTYDYLAGYIVKKAPGLPLDKINLASNEKIDVLKKLKKIIMEFEQMGIIYSDLHFDNIYYDQKTKKIKLIDIDNISIDELPVDLLSSLYKSYYSYGGYSFQNARIFVFNLISFMLITDKMSTYDIHELNYQTYQKDYDFLNKEAIHLCNNLLNMNIYSDCDNEYLIDLIDEKILVK